MDLSKKALGWLPFAIRVRLVKGTVLKLSDKDKENITRAIEDGEIHVTDTRGNVLLGVNLPELSEGVREMILDVIEDKKITWKELGEFLEEA